MANETVTEEQRILDIKVKYKDAIQSIASYKKKIEELKAAEQSQTRAGERRQLEISSCPAIEYYEGL